MTVGVAAVATTAALGAYLHLRPGLNAVDRLGFALPPASTHWWHFFRVVTRFGTWPALAVGSVSAAMVAWYTGRRDRGRALACLIGPPAAAVLDQFVIKPLVGRLYQGELSFASGSVTVIASCGHRLGAGRSPPVPAGRRGPGVTERGLDDRRRHRLTVALSD